MENFSGNNIFPLATATLTVAWSRYTGVYRYICIYIYIYSMEFPGRLRRLSCKTSPYCFARHVEEKPFHFLIDPERKTLSEETNLSMLQTLAPN